MSIKAELQSVVKTCKSNLARASQELNKAKDGGGYTPAGLQAKAEELRVEYSFQAEKSMSKALALVAEAEDNYKKGVQATTATNLHDSGYQAGLANVLQMMKNGILSEDDFQNVIKAYEGDSLALKAIKAELLQAPGGTSLLKYMHYTNEDQGDAFAQLRKNINKGMSGSPVENPQGKDFTLSWLIAAIEKLDDNLLLVKSGQ